MALSSERHQSILTSATSAAKGTRFASAWVSLSQQIKNTSPQTTGRSTHPDYLLVNLDEESIPMGVRNALRSMLEELSEVEHHKDETREQRKVFKKHLAAPLLGSVVLTMDIKQKGKLPLGPSELF